MVECVARRPYARAPLVVLKDTMGWSAERELVEKTSTTPGLPSSGAAQRIPGAAARGGRGRGGEYSTSFRGLERGSRSSALKHGRDVGIPMKKLRVRLGHMSDIGPVFLPFLHA